MRKAQGISINTIIIAAIGLAVLIVLFAIFTGRIGIFSKGVQATDSCNAKCKAINMDPGTELTSEGQDCVGEQSIGGGKFGCCCR